MAGTFLRSRLAHPLTKGLSVDDPATTELRRSIIQSKSSLAGIYRDWYREILLRLPDGPQKVLELGSGAGFLRSTLSQLITSDVLRIRGVNVIADAIRLPLAGASLRAIVMVNVFHHLTDPRRFLAEATRCVVPSGAICMVEPWVSCWSKQVYAFHSEPFDPGMRDWALPLGGPLTRGNGALPWIVFHRDRATLEMDFPAWELEEIRPMMPFRYLLSGGISLRQLAPSWAFGSVAALERALDPFLDHLAMFALIVLRRRAV